MSFVYDYAWARPSPAVLKANGAVGVMRYLTRDTTGKALTSDEVAALHADMLAIGLNFEDAPGRALAGFQAGVDDAKFANDMADKLGAPAEVVIYYSVDQELTWAQVAPYFAGIASVGRRPFDAYGDADVLLGFARTYASHRLWHSGSTSWDHGEVVQPALQQRVGSPVEGTDQNLVLTTNWGQWTPNGTATGGFLMALTDAQQEELYGIVTHFKDVLQGNPLANAVPNYFTDMHNGIGFLVAQAAKDHAAAGASVDVSALTAAIQALPHEVVVALRNALPSS